VCACVCVCVYARDSESEIVWVCVGFNAFSCSSGGLCIGVSK